MPSRHNTSSLLEILFLCMTLVAGCALGWAMFGSGSMTFVCIFGGLFTLFLLITVALMLDPDRIRARQSMNVLEVAAHTLEAMQDGMNLETAQAVCEILHPATSAAAVAITDDAVVLGYHGEGRASLGNLGSPIRTKATKLTIEDGKTRVLRTREEVGLPDNVRTIRAAIVVPLVVGNEIRGTLKYYFNQASRITETQVSVAEGFAQIISTQWASIELEEQRKLATSMELKALQSQINPHFLFNIINTIASLVRTDPAKARTMLREFATFYRQTLENSSDLIPLSREVEQTVRYLGLEQGRFGEERLAVEVDVSENIKGMKVPSFMIQPMVENSVKHAMPAEGKLTISISGEISGDDVIIHVDDDGIGMDEEALMSIMHPHSQTGLGIAVKNVNDRIRGYYGSDSHMDIQSVKGEGTQVTLVLKGCVSL